MKGDAGDPGSGGPCPVGSHCRLIFRRSPIPFAALKDCAPDMRVRRDDVESVNMAVMLSMILLNDYELWSEVEVKVKHHVERGKPIPGLGSLTFPISLKKH